MLNFVITKENHNKKLVVFNDFFLSLQHQLFRHLPPQPQS
nr:MAG TPA: hypothetical protein [Caudoviricetes sp.]